LPQDQLEKYIFCIILYNYLWKITNRDAYICQKSSESSEIFIEFFNIYLKPIQIASVPLPIILSVKNNETIKCLSTNRADLKKFERNCHFQVQELLFEAKGFGLPCTAWAGSGLLLKSRLIRIRADEGARERTRSFEIELVLAAAGRDIPIKRADRHALIYYVMHKQARWGNADADSYLIT
jgi:hypothetical protein